MGRSSLARLLSLPARLYYGWRIVALGGIINAVAGGVYNYGFAIFFLPISRDLELTRAQTSLIFSLSRAEGAIEGPFAGWLVDEFGPKHVLVGGAVLTGIGYMMLSQADSYLSFLLIYLVFISLSFNAGFAHSILAAVNTWFIRRRGLAMSAVTATAGIGAAVFTPALALLVSSFGWRVASVAAGVTLIALVVPAALAMKRSPESIGLLPDGEPMLLAGGHGYASDDGDFTFKEGIRTRAFWVLSVATTLRLGVMNVVTIQFIPLMVWKGTDELTAAFMFATMSGLSGPGRIAMGWLGDKVPKNYMLGVGMLAGCGAFAVLQGADSTWQLWLFVLAFALVESVNTLNWALVGDYYGRRSFATIRGTMSLVYTIGTASAPVLAGYVYDNTQSYSPVLWAMTASYFVGAMIFLSLRPPKPPLRVTAEKEAVLAGH